jgi:hypothetical protein
MSDQPTPSPAGAVNRAVAVNRVLTVNEVATLRAALRLWIETPVDFVPEICYVDRGGDGLIDDVAIERLIHELLGGGDGVRVTVTRFDPHDGRRI